MKEFFSQGKVLLTAEYAVLGGVKALALPTIKGQSLTVKTTESQSIVWKAFPMRINYGLMLPLIFNSVVFMLVTPRLKS